MYLATCTNAALDLTLIEPQMSLSYVCSQMKPSTLKSTIRFLALACGWIAPTCTCIMLPGMDFSDHLLCQEPPNARYIWGCYVVKWRPVDIHSICPQNVMLLQLCVLFLTSVPLLLFPFFPSFVFLSSSFPFVISLCFLSIWECQHSGTVFLLLPVVTETQHVN